MKKIGVTGGKGGTGKSTVAILLANKHRQQNQKVVLIDCDVECPNDHLLLNQNLGQPVKKVLANFPVLDKTKCQQCGLCAKQCREQAIFQPANNYPQFFHELCSSCGLCWHICPAGAIKKQKKATASIFKNQVSQNFWLVTGQTIGIVDETGPVVREVKKYGLKLAKKLKADLVICDTAVGLHCGVIQALFNLDQAYAVTEPTPLGAHDLQLIIELIKKLNIPYQVILNQADLGKPNLIKEKISQRIPYSKKLAKAYAQGRLGEIDILS